jgi:NAD-dependent dihydropyrimidine dehydrogenase PreA subunit
MIELVSETRCIGCDICVNVCPTNVFDATPDGVPVIARKSDCQTCFMCELYCPTDA